MKFTTQMKVNGELAMHRASKKAQKFYFDTEPMAVYEYETDEGKLYAYDGCFGSKEGLTFEQLDDDLEGFYYESLELCDW